MNFVIDHGIPLPPRNNGRETLYPWREMGVGDSFFVAEIAGKVMSIRAATAGFRLGVKFAARSVEGGSRVWRVA